MKTVGVAQLKAHLSEWLGAVKTFRSGEARESRRERLAKAGLLQLGSGRVRASLLRAPKGPTKVGAGVLRALLADREEGR